MMTRSIRALILTALVALTALAGLSPPAGAQEASPAAMCPPQSPEAIRAQVQAFADATDAEDIDWLRETLHDDYAHHWGVGADVLDREGYLGTMQALFDAFDDFFLTTEAVIVADDTAVIRVTVGGTQVTEFKGFPASDTPVTWTGIFIFRFDDCGQIVEAWAEFDHLGRLIHQGLIVPPMATPAP